MMPSKTMQLNFGGLVTASFGVTFNMDSSYSMYFAPNVRVALAIHASIHSKPIDIFIIAQNREQKSR